MADFDIMLISIADFSVLYKSIILTQRFYLMRNPRESFPSFIPEHYPIRYNPTENNGLTQKIESNVRPSNN